MQIGTMTRRAENVTGLNLVPKIRIPIINFIGVVEEHFLRCEGFDASRTGAQRRENVGMSNRKSDAKSDHRKPEVSLAM